MTMTETLAVLIGLYFSAAGIGVLVDRNSFDKVMDELTSQPLLGYLGGILAFAIGGTIVSLHNDWSSFLSGFVSLVGWICLAEGVLMLAVRKWFLGIFARMALSSGTFTVFGAGTFLAGVVILAVVFFN